MLHLRRCREVENTVLWSASPCQILRVVSDYTECCVGAWSGQERSRAAVAVGRHLHPYTVHSTPLRPRPGTDQSGRHRVAAGQTCSPGPGGSAGSAAVAQQGDAALRARPALCACDGPAACASAPRRNGRNGPPQTYRFMQSACPFQSCRPPQRPKQSASSSLPVHTLWPPLTVPLLSSLFLSPSFSWLPGYLPLTGDIHSKSHPDRRTGTTPVPNPGAVLGS